MIDLTKTYVAFATRCQDAILDNGKHIKEIFELSAVKIIDGKIVKNFSTFVNIKNKKLWQESGCCEFVYGVYLEHLLGAPKIEGVMSEFFEFAKDAILMPYDSYTTTAIVHYTKENDIKLPNDFFRTTLLFDKYEDISNKVFVDYNELVTDIKECLEVKNIKDDTLGKAIILAKLFLYVADAVKDDEEKDVIKIDTITYRSALQYKQDID